MAGFGVALIYQFHYLHLSRWTSRNWSGLTFRYRSIVKPSYSGHCTSTNVVGKATGQFTTTNKDGLLKTEKFRPTKSNPLIPHGAIRQTIKFKEIVDLLNNGTGVFTLFGVPLNAKAIGRRKDQNGLRTVLVVPKLEKYKPVREMGKTIVRPAALVKQGQLTLYSTSLKVSDLLIPDFYSVETLDPEDPSDKGYQRLLNKARAKKLADYIVAGQETKDAFLPTSIFIATHKDIAFSPSSNTISINIDEIGPFSVVDGQHRVEGLKMAAEKDTRVLDFEVPVNIAINLSKIAQM